MSPPAPVAAAEHGWIAEPVHGTLTGHVTVVVEGALVIAKVLGAATLPVWSPSPANVALAVAVPTLTLLVYVTVTGVLSPPAPVASAEHGVCADPV